MVNRRYYKNDNKNKLNQLSKMLIKEIVDTSLQSRGNKYSLYFELKKQQI